mgnify:CR=1 FL=1|tara:strand:+ start:465 stop:581 length:117 start_codon:yes stop_codon:yes gene_type:complete
MSLELSDPASDGGVKEERADGEGGGGRGLNGRDAWAAA